MFLYLLRIRASRLVMQQVERRRKKSFAKGVILFGTCYLQWHFEWDRL